MVICCVSARSSKADPSPAVKVGEHDLQMPITIIHSGSVTADNKVDSEIAALTLRLSSAVRQNAMTLTPLGQAASSTSTVRAESFNPGSRPLNSQTMVGNSASLAKVSPRPPSSGAGDTATGWRRARSARKARQPGPAR